MGNNANCYASNAKNIIEIDGVIKQYGHITALHEMNLSVRQGEFLSLLGPSGCGKTTLLRIIAGFLDPTAGELRISGISMKGVPPNKRPVNTVFQNYALFPHMTIAENIAFGPLRQGRKASEIAQEVTKSLTMLGMEGFHDRYPKSLSGGQQQRIALARAIINRPRVLLLDEPLGALDLKLRKRMQFELKRLHDQLGITFIYVTHDQEEALSMSDRIAVMSAGRIIQLGSGEEIYQRPNSSYVADFIGDANLIEGYSERGYFRLTDGHAVCACDKSLSGPVKLMVRPEHISFDQDCGQFAQKDKDSVNGQPGNVRLTATVLQKVFLGHSWRITMRLADGQKIIACSTETGSARVPEQGQPTILCWAESSSPIFAS